MTMHIELETRRAVPVAERKPIRPTQVTAVREPVKVIKPIAPRVETVPAHTAR